jgi:N6-L-threonylcarbamoyladenine synthase
MVKKEIFCYNHSAMKILAIETSCDETAIAVLEIKGKTTTPKITRLAHSVASQIELHAQYGGVFPMMAKREHAKAFVPLLLASLKKAKLAKKSKKALPEKIIAKVRSILEREPEMSDTMVAFLSEIAQPSIDVIAVTTGPGLEPALWVGVNAAKALALAWDIPIIGVNHMEGHVLSVLVQEKRKGQKTFTAEKLHFPVLSLLVSGGHTELVLMKDWRHYKKIGATRDDAAGEAFDKVARMLELPYPGGPKISALAHTQRGKNVIPKEYALPRPMITSNDFDFSFSGLKTAVLYLLKKISVHTDEIKAHIAHEFENAVVEVLTHKTLRALKKYKCTTLVVGGGVASNTHLRTTLTREVKKTFPKMKVYFPEKELATDNAFMIGIAGYFEYLKTKKGKRPESLRAQGNLSL